MPVAVDRRRSTLGVPPRSAKGRVSYDSSSRGTSGGTPAPRRSRAVSSSYASSFASFILGRSMRPWPPLGEEGFELRGAFTAEIVADPALSYGSSTYALKVSGIDGEHVVQRRYSCFVRMSDALSQGSPQFPLPPLPPKSFFRRRLSLQFREERVRALGQLAAAAVARDPFATDPAMRRFLGLAAGAGEGSKAALRPESWLCLMDTISEAENETQTCLHDVKTARGGSSAKLPHGTCDASSQFDLVPEDAPGTRLGPGHAQLARSGYGVTGSDHATSREDLPLVFVPVA